MKKNYVLNFKKKFAFLAIATVLLGLGANAQCTPALTLSTVSASVCAGKTGTLIASGATTYTWTWSTGSANTASLAVTTADNYTISATNASACVTTSVIPVTILAIPSISAVASSTLVCSGNTVILSGQGGTGYTWNPSIANNVAFTPGSTANYTVTGTGTNVCTNTAVVTVVVINTPSIVPVASPTAICVGQTSTLTAQGATGYTWTALNFGGSNNFSVAVSPTITTAYTIQRANGSCTTSAVINVIVNNLPPVAVTPTAATVCACTGSIQIVAFGGITYTWMPSATIGQTLLAYPCVTTNYSVFVSNSFCTTYTTVLVTVSPNPTITISASSPSMCLGGAVTLTANGAPNFTWTTNPVQPNPPNLNVVTVNPTQPTLYTATGSSTANCVTSSQQVIVVYPNPVVNVVTSNSLLCNGATATLTASSPSVPIIFNWAGGPLNSPTKVVSPTVTTNYTVTGVYQTGCNTTTVFPLTVYIATFVVSTPSAVCSGVSNTITATGAAQNYTWRPTTPLQTFSAAVVSPTASTIYTVTGATGPCVTTRTVNVPVNALPPVAITAPKWTICLYDGVELTATSGTNATTYSWSTGETSSAITFTTTHWPGELPTQTTTFALTGTDVNGCVKTVTATVYVQNCIGINELTGATVPVMDVYPNPNNGEFVVKSDMPMHVVIFNELGQAVKEVELNETVMETSFNGLSGGIYFIVGESNGTRVTRKLVVNK